MIKIRNKYLLYYGKTSGYILMYLKPQTVKKHRTQFMMYNKLLNLGQSVAYTTISVT